MVGNTPSSNTGALGGRSAWNGVGRYLVWSDAPNNAQMRWIEDDGGHDFAAAGNSNGNTFDYEGRRRSCEHAAAASCATK